FHVTGVQTCALPISSLAAQADPLPVTHARRDAGGHPPASDVERHGRTGHGLAERQRRDRGEVRTTLRTSGRAVPTPEQPGEDVRSEERRVGNERSVW